jgi:hypothetical protein
MKKIKTMKLALAAGFKENEKNGDPDWIPVNCRNIMKTKLFYSRKPGRSLSITLPEIRATGLVK